MINESSTYSVVKKNAYFFNPNTLLVLLKTIRLKARTNSITVRAVYLHIYYLLSFRHRPLAFGAHTIMQGNLIPLAATVSNICIICRVFQYFTSETSLLRFYRLLVSGTSWIWNDKFESYWSQKFNYLWYRHLYPHTCFTMSIVDYAYMYDVLVS